MRNDSLDIDMEMTLAVIIPNYNNSEYLVQCIESVMNQSYQPNEVIVFDDCSSDCSKDILLLYQNKYNSLQCIFSEVNVGVAKARHIAITEAKSSYITVLDSDDYYLSTDKLLNEMNTIQKYSSLNKKYICAFSQVTRVDQQGKLIDHTKIKSLESHTRFKTVTRMYRTNVPRDFCFAKEAYLLAGGYDFSCNLFEDWDLDLRLLKHSCFVFSKGLGTAYRQKDDGLSNVSYNAQYQAKKSIFKKNKKYTEYSMVEIVVFYFVLFLTNMMHKIVHYVRK